jgi:hypothetical protein
VPPQQGQKVFTLRTLPTRADGEYGQLVNIQSLVGFGCFCIQTFQLQCYQQ